MRKISKEIDKDKANIAQTLSTALATQGSLNDVKNSLATVDVDKGKSYQQKRRKKDVKMSGTSQSFSFNSKYSFKNYKSVVMTLSAASHVHLYATMISPNRFTITAESEVSDLDIIVMMRGD